MSQTAVCSTKEALWLSCREKSCCTHYSVIPTGRDIWRISQRMHLPPSVFTRYTDAAPDAAHGFTLDQSGKRYCIVLAKRSAEQQQTTGDCLFLLRLPSGHAQCGLGDLRPMVCRSYPSILSNGVLCVGECSGCSCRVWVLAQMDIEQETELAQTLERERAEYRDVIQDWNQRVQRAKTGRQYDYLEFCNYLMNVYAARVPCVAPVESA